MKLQIFDFDDTLFKTGGDTRLYRWYDKPESLDPKLYHLQLIETVARIAKDGHDNPKIKQVLITKRIPELATDIMNLLDESGIHLNRYCFIGHDANKPDVLADLLAKSYNEIDFTEIEIYEDCMFQLLEYERFFKAIHYPNRITVRYFFVDKKHLIEFPLGSLNNAVVLEKLKVNYP